MVRWLRCMLVAGAVFSTPLAVPAFQSMARAEAGSSEDAADDVEKTEDAEAESASGDSADASDAGAKGD